ncbi:deaminase [Streptomyces albidoflavus]|nr:deaminase [Streptomyces albidoflavus]
MRPLLPSPVQELREPAFERYGVRLLLKRDDLIHPDIPGNKWRKLAPVLREADGRTVVTFGGAWSNHLRATAAAGRLLFFFFFFFFFGGEELGRPSSQPSRFARCRADGMRLAFVSRSLVPAQGRRGRPGRAGGRGRRSRAAGARRARGRFGRRGGPGLRGARRGAGRPAGERPGGRRHLRHRGHSGRPRGGSRPGV